VKSRENRSHPSEEDRWQRSPSPMHSGVQRLRGVTFDIRSREVPRAEAHVDTWQSHKVGPMHDR
jgi:hypothetical protein